MSILNHFPAGRTPRPQQIAVLHKIEEVWDEADVIVIDAPVAFGKSNLAQTVSRWALSKYKKMSRILTPTNILVEQYLKDFPTLHTLPAASTFKCADSIEYYPDTAIEAYSHSCSKQKGKGEKVYCTSCPYIKAKKAGYAKPFGVYNYYTYMANKYYRPILIADECHNLMGTLRELNAKKYWQSEWGYPSSVRTYGQLFKWVNDSIPRFSGNQQKRLEYLKQELISNRTRFIVERAVESLRGHDEDVIKLLPVDIRNGGGLLWPKKVEKIVLLSATMNRNDIESLGLDNRRVVFISAESSIPKERRPIIIEGSLNLSFKHQMENLPKVIEWLQNILANKKERGIVHLTYSLARLLKPYLEENPRLLWHTAENKMAVYRQFLTAGTDAVLMACGLYEGIDLPEDLGRWQVLIKVPFPSLESPAIKFMAETQPEWFANETIRVVQQMSGRICRTPEDYGETIVLDSSFQKLYDEYRNLFSSWFIEAVVPNTQENQ